LNKYFSINVLPLPSKLLKTWSGVTRWLLAAVLLAWLLLGLVWGALTWLIVPRIDEFRPTLEALVTRTLGVPVRIGAISAQSSGLMPSFELTEVTLLDAQSRVALSLPRVLVAVSPRSSWRLGFEQVYLDAPKLDVRRLSDGRITVAGLDLANAQGQDATALNWFFSQIEFAIHDGVLRWTDEQRGTDTLVLQKVDAVVRNLGRHHDVRLDATPPPAWGERFSVRGRFLQPLLSRQNGRWQDWDGEVYSAFERIDLSELRRYVDLGVNLSQGRGTLRAWVDVRQGVATGATADVALSEVNVTLGHDLAPLVLREVQGRVGGRMLAGGFELFTQALSFEALDGLRWPGGNLHVAYRGADGKTPARGELQADRLDLAALAAVAQRLPLQPHWREKLVAYAPKGQVEKLVLGWQGPGHALEKYNAKGRISALDLAAVVPAPGLRGLGVEFELDQQSGRASVVMNQGSVDLPGILQDSLIEVGQLSGQVRWQTQGERIAIQATELTFANVDTQGTAQVKWETSNVGKAGGGSRFPGVLDLQANLSRVDVTRVHRYLPLVIDQEARDYVREAVKAGTASNVRFAIKGDINQMPQIDPRQGSFRVSADVRDAALDYVPRSLQTPQELPWPSLTGLSGQLVIDRIQLSVKEAKARFTEVPTVQITRAEAQIADLEKTTVVLNAELKGPLGDALRVVNSAPLGGLLGDVLAHSLANGPLDAKFKLVLPIAQMDKSTVQGSLVFAGNDVQITPDSPKLTRARGQLNFSQSGLSLVGVQARLLGGEARLDGGLVLGSGADAGRTAPTLIRATGTASAEGLRQANELGFVARLANQANGSAAYTATLGFRRGVHELVVQSDLQGMALSLPAPLQKSAAKPLALRLQTEVLNIAPAGPGQVAPLHERLSLNLGGVGSLVYEHDFSGAVPRVLRGAIGVGLEGFESVALPMQGVTANIKLSQFNVDAWTDTLSQLSGSGSAESSQLAQAYLPTTLAVRADTLSFGGRQFNQVVLGGGREGNLWRANLDANELNGYLEYRQPTEGVAASAARVYARLARLTVTPSTATDVEALLDAPPTSVPALDIVVDDFELRGKRLGRLEVEAINRSAASQSGAPGGVREWRLNKFNLTVPEATLTASGNWTRVNAQGAALAAANMAGPERRRTVLNFKLDIVDGGALLARMGMKDVVRQASGKLQGQIAWLGSPLKLDYPTLGGAFTVNVASGQFLKADPGITKLLGVLSLQALPRRLTLDFRDVFSDGFAFDFLRGDVTVERGIARTNNLQMKGVNAAVLMEGQADIAQETQDLKVVVVPEINAGTASLLATVINPAVGLGTFLAEVFLRRPLIESNTQELHVTGSWTDPQVAKVSKTPVIEKEKSP
jgi:uncharacterized protein (TIGR02099 family)